MLVQILFASPFHAQTVHRRSYVEIKGLNDDRSISPKFPGKRMHDLIELMKINVDRKSKRYICR